MHLLWLQHLSSDYPLASQKGVSEKSDWASTMSHQCTFRRFAYISELQLFSHLLPWCLVPFRACETFQIIIVQRPPFLNDPVQILSAFSHSGGTRYSSFLLHYPISRNGIGEEVCPGRYVEMKGLAEKLTRYCQLTYKGSVFAYH